MGRCQSEGFAKHSFLCAISLLTSAAAGGFGCTTYTDLDGPDVRPTSDAPTPPSDRATSDNTPGDTGGNIDTGGSTDTPLADTARDNPVEVAPPVDMTMPDRGADAAVDADASLDMTPPGFDAEPDAGSDAGTDVDGTVPPGPETGPDVRAPDADANPRDADAPTPPPDADGGTGPIDVRDGGPTCWGPPSTHDEDGDGVVDECDNCPSVSNASQADVGEVNAGGSADGVGDGCDPRPSAGG